ncbi:hypothetical protein CP01DC11_1481, partial [Chlamydia psittaci 01DC11]
PRPTQDTTRRFTHFAYGNFTLYVKAFQLILLYVNICQTSLSSPTTPTTSVGLGFSPFARHY